VARALWHLQPDFFTATEAWLASGGPHHSVLTAALGIDAISDLATIAGIELVVIDESTRLRELQNELRWNDAYHHVRCR
jgi:L-arabinose isomerase